MFKNFYYFCLINLILLNANTIEAKKNFCVSAPAYPLTVTAEKQKTASEIIFFCNSYVNYLKNVWGVSAKHVTPLNIIIEIPFKKNCNPEIIQAHGYTKFYPDINDKFFKQILCAFIAGHFIKSDLSFDKKTHPIVPKCITVGISGTFLKEKIDPAFSKTHKTLIEGHLIPFNEFLGDSSYNYNTNDRLFTLQSIYFANFLISQNFGKIFFIKFLQQYSFSPEQGIAFLLNSFQVKSIPEFENLFLKQMARKLKVYNIVSTQKKYSTESILFLLDEILVFQYKDNESSYISIKASNLKVKDMPFITRDQIYQKIIQFNVLTGSSPEQFHPVIKEYINSLNYLMDGSFSEYFDSFHKATFLKDLLKRNKKL